MYAYWRTLLKWNASLAAIGFLTVTLTGSLFAKGDKPAAKHSTSATKKQSVSRSGSRNPRGGAAHRPTKLTSRGGFRKPPPILNAELFSEELSGPKAILVQKSNRRLTLYKN